MRIAIVDDEQAMREQLTKYIGQYAGEKRLALDTCLFPSGDVLLKSQDRDFDIIVFDIDMPGTNGLDTARKIRETDENVVILFVTNIAQYAINGYEVDAVDYMLAMCSTMVSAPSSTAKSFSREAISVRSPSTISASWGTYFMAGSPGSTKARTSSPRSIN